MSWQEYVDTNLVGTGNVDKAAIWDAEGKGCWARSAGFDVPAAEMKAIAALFNTPEKAFESGFKVRGEKYMTIKAEPQKLYGKKGREGAIIAKTNLAILITTHPESVLSNSAAGTVESLAEYMRGVGY